MGDLDLQSLYSQYDPSHLRNFEPEYINLKGTQKERGRFELAFGQIGASYLIGGGLGVIGGLFRGYKEANSLQLAGKLHRTHILNHVLKGGGAWAQVAGTIALIYSVAGMGLILQRGCDDDVNTAGAATATGLIYQATAGIKKSIIGGLFGLSAVSPFVLWNHGSELLVYLKRIDFQQRSIVPSYIVEDKEILDFPLEELNEDLSEFEN